MLKDAAERGVYITILFSRDELELFERSLISDLPHIEICCCAEINSKCYFNENNMLITSADLHSCHENKGGDMGVALNRKDDEILYDDAKKLYETFYEASIKLVSEKITNTEKTATNANAYHGFCIRCAMPISFNIAKPYCRQCMKESTEESDDDRMENYCHSCAKNNPVSRKKPQCVDCSTI
jgi:hypothetical protein